jgi:hypothetical protein
MLRAQISGISPHPPKRAGHKGPRVVPTNLQRRELRKWWNDDSHGHRKHKDAIAWWKHAYSTELPPSTCSDILSTKWAFLDDRELSKHEANVQKGRKPQWSTLEAALIEWQIRYDLHPDSGSTTGALLRLKATEFWEKLPEYNGLPCPKWTEGWLSGFKKRHSLKERRRHGEAGSAQLNEESEVTMEEIRKAGEEYNAEDIYNMDETGYYWKMKPDRSLSTLETSGKKMDKARITAALTCNATGTHRLPIWYIGTACRPNCFRAEGLSTLDHLGAFWRYNKTAWMNHHIMKEYLCWFNNQMRIKGKKALLLIDDFSAYELSVELMEEAKELTYTKVMWLPPNATSIYQPLDQGIIQNWKSHVKKQFVIFIASTFDQGKDLSKEIYILQAVC